MVWLSREADFGGRMVSARNYFVLFQSRGLSAFAQARAERRALPSF
jgi:hypothetical protein